MERKQRNYTNILRNLQDLYKKVKENNRINGISPGTCLFKKNFDEILASRDVWDIAELKEVFATRKSYFNLFDGMKK